MDEKDMREADATQLRRFQEKGLCPHACEHVTEQQCSEAQCREPLLNEGMKDPHGHMAESANRTLNRFQPRVLPREVLDSVRTITYDLGRAIPHSQCGTILHYHLSEVIQRFVKKQTEYGETADELGSMGQYADMSRKTRKLRRLMWDKSVPEDAISESAEEVLQDLIGHALLAIYYIRKETDDARALGDRRQ